MGFSTDSYKPEIGNQPDFPFDNGTGNAEYEIGGDVSKAKHIGLAIGGATLILAGLVVFGKGVAMNLAPGFNVLSPVAIFTGMAMAFAGLAMFKRASEHPPELG